MYEVTEKILREVRKVIVGKDDVVEKVWISILAQGHVLLEDVPGVGKTTMALMVRLSRNTSNGSKPAASRGTAAYCVLPPKAMALNRPDHRGP